MSKWLRAGCLWLAIGCGGIIVIAVIAFTAGLANSGARGNQPPSAAPTNVANRPTVTQPAPTAKPNQAPTAKPAPAATSKPEPTAVPTLPSVGNKVAAGNWEIELLGVDGAARLGTKAAQGQFLIITVSAKNLHRETSQLNTNDFQISSGTGTRYSVSSDGSSALLSGSGPDVMLFGAQIQPGLAKQFRLVFDVNPAEQDFVLKAAGILFRL